MARAIASVISIKNPEYFYWRKILETKIWELVVFVAIGMAFILGYLIWKAKKKRKKKNVLMYVNMHIYKYFYV